MDVYVNGHQSTCKQTLKSDISKILNTCFFFVKYIIDVTVVFLYCDFWHGTMVSGSFM